MNKLSTKERAQILAVLCEGMGINAVGDSYGNALAETINALCKAEVIHRQSWKNREVVEMAALTWVDWLNHRRLLEPIGNIPPAEVEIRYYQQLSVSAIAA